MADDRQPDAQAAVRAPAAAVELAEAVEHERLELRGDAAAGVANPDHDLLVFGCDVELDAAARRRELDRVRQQVQIALLQVDGVAGEVVGQRADGDRG